jgi:hypothetical protein
MWTNWEEKVDPNAKLPRHLFWDVNIEKMDWQEAKYFVVERVVERGMPKDYYTLFQMYGGVEGVRDILKNIKYFRFPQDIAFICMAFDFKKEELECYKRRLLREQLLNS